MGNKYERERLEAKRKIARMLTPEGLAFAIADCQLCIETGVEPDRYRDEIAEYRAELERRTSKRKKA